MATRAFCKPLGVPSTPTVIVKMWVRWQPPLLDAHCEPGPSALLIMTSFCAPPESASAPSQEKQAWLQPCKTLFT